MNDLVIKSAMGFAETGDPAHLGAATADDFADAMLDLAKDEARDGESAGAALTRLIVDRDDRVQALANAEFAAGAHAEHSALQKRRDAREGMNSLADAYVRSQSAEGEDLALAYRRLAVERDPVLAKMLELMG